MVCTVEKRMNLTLVEYEMGGQRMDMICMQDKRRSDLWMMGEMGKEISGHPGRNVSDYNGKL